MKLRNKILLPIGLLMLAAGMYLYCGRDKPSTPVSEAPSATSLSEVEVFAEDATTPSAASAESDVPADAPATPEPVRSPPPELE